MPSIRSRHNDHLAGFLDNHLGKEFARAAALSPDLRRYLPRPASRLSGAGLTLRILACMHSKPKVKRSAAQYAVLSRLLDEALERDGTSRAQWLSDLPHADAEYRTALEQILAFNDPAATRRLALLEARLRSGARAVRRLR